MSAYLGAVFLVLGFIALLKLLGLVERSRRVVATSRAAMSALSDKTLDDDQKEAAMQTHATIGGDTLRQVVERHQGHTFLLMGMEIAYSHHERWDGRGYPRGLVGRRIPLSARIVAVADAYDAITSARPYKPAYDHAEAVRRILEDSAAHFDPELVVAFERCHEEFAAIRRRLMDRKEA